MMVLTHGDQFRIGYTEYRVWTLGGFYIDGIKDAAVNEVRYGWSINPMYTGGLEAYKVEQRRRGSEDRGASPQSAMLTGDRAEAARRVAAFQALPELKDGQTVLLRDTVGQQPVQYTLRISRRHNDHIIFEVA